MNPAIRDLERAITKFQDELLEDAETFRASLEAFRKTKAKRGGDRYLTLYGQMYADLTQLKNSAETVQEYLDHIDALEDLLSESNESKVA